MLLVFGWYEHNNCNSINQYVDKQKPIDARLCHGLVNYKSSDRKSTYTILTCFSSIAAFASSASTNGLEKTEVCRLLSPIVGFGSLGFVLSVGDLKIEHIHVLYNEF